MWKKSLFWATVAWFCLEWLGKQQTWHSWKRGDGYGRETEVKAGECLELGGRACCWTHCVMNPFTLIWHPTFVYINWTDHLSFDSCINISAGLLTCFSNSWTPGCCRWSPSCPLWHRALNTLSWKGPIRIIQTLGVSWPCTGHPKSDTMCLRVLSKGFLSSVRLTAVTTFLGSCSSAQQPPGWRALSLYPA